MVRTTIIFCYQSALCSLFLFFSCLVVNTRNSLKKKFLVKQHNMMINKLKIIFLIVTFSILTLVNIKCVNIHCSNNICVGCGSGGCLNTNCANNCDCDPNCNSTCTCSGYLTACEVFFPNASSFYFGCSDLSNFFLFYFRPF